MTADPPLASRLLEAQVAWLANELGTGGFDAVVADAIDDLLAAVADITLEELADRADVAAAVRHLLTDVVASPVVEDLVGELADTVYDLPASEEILLGDVVDRGAVSALIAKVLATAQLRDRLLDRMAESPLVGTVVARFVTQLVADFLDQNRARAEKLPGMASVFALGAGAASRMRGVTDQLLGDTAGRSAQYAMRRTGGAVRELSRDAPLHDAALELWDLHAAEPVGELRGYLSAADLRELALLVHRLVVDARGTEWSVRLVDDCVATVFDRYGAWDVTSLLGELGLDRAVLVRHAQLLGGRALRRLHEDGTLADLLRRRLAPFFDSPEVAQLLGN